jgi:PKHD-type hydroxylase
MPYRLDPPAREFARFAVFEDGFSWYDLKWIEDTVRSVPIAPALVGNEREEKAVTRKSVLRWLPAVDPWIWLYQRLNLIINDVNGRYWRYDLTEMQDIQHTEYTAPGGHYTWHQDSGAGPFAGRKLSLSVVLTNPREHEGGVFELFEHGPIPARLGDVILFPSHEFHRVTPVTSGVRRSLVCWVAGPELR